MKERDKLDIVIIGSGPGGYVAAIRAAQLGLKVAVVEREQPGGVCLNVGCIPSKALIEQAALYNSIGRLESLGIKCDPAHFSYEKVYKKSRLASSRLAKGVSFLLKKSGITYINEEGRITGKGRVELSKSGELRAKNIIIAAGARPKELPIFPFDGDKVISSTGALMLKELPARMAILGSGAIGVEFAHIFSSFGVDVHLIEMLDNLLPGADREAVGLLEREFKKKKVNLYTGTTAASYKVNGQGLALQLEKSGGGASSTLEVDKLLVAVGRTANIEGLGLESVGVTPDRGAIPVGDYYQTSCDGVFAIGDIIDSPQLAHLASKEGEIAVEYIAGRSPEPRVDYDLIPAAVYCEPQIAWFGKGEESLKAAGTGYEVASFPYRGAGKAVAAEKGEGLVKLFYDPAIREILGAVVAGAEASELIHELLLAKKAELLPEDISTMIHAHPTLSEAVMEAVRAIEGRAIHI